MMAIITRRVRHKHWRTLSSISLKTLLFNTLLLGMLGIMPLSHANTLTQITLPTAVNSPASADVDENGVLYFSSPNFHNDALLKTGDLEEALLPVIGRLNQQNQFEIWYQFGAQDLSPITGKIAPMGIAFGPDGNLYVADMQMWFAKGMGKSRIVRLNIEAGNVISSDTVVTGLIFPNAVAWKGDTLFVSDTVLQVSVGKPTISGVYRFQLNELKAPESPADNDAIIEIIPYKNPEHYDPHLMQLFESNGTLGFGANGLTFDSQGNLYTALMENGSIMKTILDENNQLVDTEEFASGLLATDGMDFDPVTNKLYVADLFANAIYSVDMQGDVSLIQQNDDTDGAQGLIDAPSEVVVRGNELVIMNFDALFNHPDMVNKSTDPLSTLTIIPLNETNATDDATDDN